MEAGSAPGVAAVLASDLMSAFVGTPDVPVRVAGGDIFSCVVPGVLVPRTGVGPEPAIANLRVAAPQDTALWQPCIACQPAIVRQWAQSLRGA